VHSRSRSDLLKNRFSRYLRSRGHSVTWQRTKVLEEILKVAPHFDVEELTARLQRRRAGVSRATVYRTVGHLQEGGFLRELDLDTPHAHFEVVADRVHHEHLVCSRCGRVVEASDAALEKRIDAMARKHGFAIVRHQVQITGLCAQCSAGARSGKKGGRG